MSVVIYRYKYVVVDPTAIWTAPNRTLTSFTGQPRIDLLGEDSSFEAGTGARKSLIDRLANIAAFDTPIEGSVIMDGTEKILVLDEISGNPQRFLEGYIDLSPLQDGDTIIIKHYIKIKADDDYKEYYSREYSNKQPTQLLYVATKTAKYGIKITAKQTKGIYRTLNFQFFRRRVA
jgi:hypothetical protein